VFAKTARAKPGYILSDVWNLGVKGHDIPPDASGDLLAVWRLCIQLDRTLTIRQARWIARLRSALPDASPEALLIWSTFYDRRERTAERQGQLLNTADLDAELAFQVWKSRLHIWEYQQAVLTGTVRSHSPIGPQVDLLWRPPDPIVMEFFLCNARQFLREAYGHDIDQQPWWPHAESVTALWLRHISARVPKWERVGYLSFDDRRRLPVWEEWLAMGRRLANLVIAKAMALQTGTEGASEVGTEEGDYALKPWRPAELLREFGYHEEDTDGEAQG
jgi:hypothetical protein